MFEIDIGIIGGILLILGAWALYLGNLQYSIILYFVADLCWAGLAWQAKEYLGVFFILVGMLLGLGVYLKMHTGVFHKKLQKK